MFETMPSPASTKTRSGKYGPFQQVRRDVRTRWVLNPEAEGVPQIVVDLTTYHYGDSKRYGTSLTWGTVEPTTPGSVFHVETWASDHAMKQVAVTPVARYSVKTMEAHHAAALAEVEQRFSHFAYVFTEAAERSGLTVGSES